MLMLSKSNLYIIYVAVILKQFAIIKKMVRVDSRNNLLRILVYGDNS